MSEARDQRIFVESELRKAIDAEQFEVAYQPSVNLTDGSIVGFEALLRWPHPTRGPIPPSTFIPIAEATGSIVELGRWVLTKACMTATAWPENVRIAVNVSALQFRNGDIEQVVAEALDASGLKPSRLELEVTESLLLEDIEHVVAVAGRLQALGVKLALDDFGTGYASLTYLQKLPFDRLKIDRSFVSSIEDDETAAIVAGIVGMSRDRSVTAEGVETRRQLALAALAGCDEVQGYLFSRPVPEGDALRLCRDPPAEWRKIVEALPIATRTTAKPAR